MRILKKVPSKLSEKILLGFALIILMTTIGCATWDDRDPRPPELSLPKFISGSLHKKVALCFFDNQTQLRFDEVEQAFFKPLNDLIKAGGPNLRLYTPYDPNFPPELIQAVLVDETGARDNMAIAQVARQFGFNAVIIGRLDNITGLTKKKGFWLFKKNQHYQKIMTQVDMFAAETGAKLLSEIYAKEIAISNTQFQALARSSVENSSMMIQVLSEVAEDIADDICDRLNDTAWIGFVTRVTDKMVTLSTGKEIGLEPGFKLELYSSNRIFKDANGGHFFVPGIKTGQIQITAVNANSAQATLLPDAKAEAGYAVRLH